jgi:hypothetical protein
MIKSSFGRQFALFDIDSEGSLRGEGLNTVKLPLVYARSETESDHRLAKTIHPRRSDSTGPHRIKAQITYHFLQVVKICMTSSKCRMEDLDDIH